MIKEHCFSTEWFEHFKNIKEFNKIDLKILEKMIYALHLVEQLALSGLKFVFKGGTSLALQLDQWNRFSIDIDIITMADRKELESTLDSIIQNSRFINYSLDESRSYKPDIPKAHYKLFFNSTFSYSGSILLDVLFEEPQYPETITLPITSKWIETGDDIFVTVPSIDAITGDKLTAFAPNTIGIPYYKGALNHSFTMEIIKQLYDLSILFNHIKRPKIVARSYFLFASKEIDYRKTYLKNISVDKTLKDTIETCLLLVKRDRNKGDDKILYNELQKGIKAFGGSYLVSENFRIEEAIVAAGKVTLLSAVILTQDYSKLSLYDSQYSEVDSITNTNWNFLNKLKKFSKEGFFYGSKTSQILDSIR